LEWWINTAEQRGAVLRAWDLSGCEAVLSLGHELDGAWLESWYRQEISLFSKTSIPVPGRTQLLV
jgi:hypothetical protein